MTDRRASRPLDLLDTEPPTPSRSAGAHRHRKPGRGQRSGSSRHTGDGRRSRGGRTLTALVLVLIMLGALGSGIWYGGSKLVSAFGNTPDYSGSGSGTVTVQIMPGDTASDVARTLAKAGVVKSAKAFVTAAEKDPRSTSLQPGTYQLRKQMSAAIALKLLLDPASRLRLRVTLPEGLSVVESLDRIAAATGIPLAELRAAAKDTAGLGLPAWAMPASGKPAELEGFLFPATYELQPDMSAETILRTMVAKFVAMAEVTGLEQRAAALKLSPYQALIVASMVQKEGRAASDNPKIARVIYNRLARSMPLAIDATVLYGLGRSSGTLTQADLNKVTPYNTRRVKGLPPTPIASPGMAVIEDTLTPASGNWIYYVLMDKEGHHLFTNDYQAFLAQKAKSQREGLF